MIRTAILGASGYVGGELLRLLAAHPQLRATKLFGQQNAGRRLAHVHPHLGSFYPDALIDSYDETKLEDIDLVMAALPHGESQHIAHQILNRSIPCVDAGADFRLARDTYEHWYGHAHQAPQLLGNFVYGIPEINREAIGRTKAVAAAGCYATAAILALKPFVDAGLVEAGSIIVDATSGVSGAGRDAKEATSFNSISGSSCAYALLNHRHIAEMEMALGSNVLFTPHLAPQVRGIHVTGYANAVQPFDALSVLNQAYDGEPFVHVVPEPPATKWVSGSNGAVVSARYDDRTNRLLTLCVIDNLGKGAAGQMVQCANVMLGLEESAGLTSVGMFP